MSYIKRSKKNGKVYLSEVETKRIEGKVVTRHIRYIGKEVDGETVLSSSLSNVEVDEVKIYGPLLVLNHLAQEIGLSSVLGNYGNEILSMVYAHCIDYESVNQMPSWYERTDLSMLLDLEGLTEERLLKALDSLEAQAPTQLQKKIFDRMQSRYELNTNGIVYDVTNTYLYGKKCPFGKLGKDKAGVKGRPLIQIGLGVTQDEGVPVFHKIFHGNIHDSRTLQDLLTTFRAFGLRSGLMIFDRGISSKKNQLDIRDLNWKVLCGLPLDSGLKKVLRDILSESDFLEFRHRVKLNKTRFHVKTLPHCIAGVKGKLAFCFNEKKKRELKESRYAEVENAQLLLKGGKQIKAGLNKFFGKDGRILSSKVRAAEEFDGYSAIFTTASCSKEKMVKMYFDKDLVEKAFQSIKGVIKLRPIRHWLYNRVVAHVFVCYLSYLLLTLLQIRLSKTEFSPVAALKELDTLYKVYLRDSKKKFRLTRVVALNKNQEKILKAIDTKLLTQV